MSPKLGQTTVIQKRRERDCDARFTCATFNLGGFVSNEIKISAIIPSRVKRVYI